MQEYRSTIVVSSCGAVLAAGGEGREQQQPQQGARGGGFRPAQLLGLGQEAPVPLGSLRPRGFWRRQPCHLQS